MPSAVRPDGFSRAKGLPIAAKQPATAAFRMVKHQAGCWREIIRTSNLANPSGDKSAGGHSHAVAVLSRSSADQMTKNP